MTNRFSSSTMAMHAPTPLLLSLLLLLSVAAAAAARTAPSTGNGPVSATSALLSDLYLSTGTLDPEFDPAVYSYTVSLNSSVSEVKVYVAEPPDQLSAGSGININGTWVDSGEYSPSVTLGDPGYTTTIAVYVLAIGYSPESYVVYVSRAAEAESGGGLSWWWILIIVIVCLLVVALLAYLVYWAYNCGYLDWIPGVAGRRTGGGSDYGAIP